MTTSIPETIDAYIAGFYFPVQELLGQVSRCTSVAARTARETIGYAIPTLVLLGNPVHYAGFRNHIGFYPSPSGINAFEEELSGFILAKGSVKFPYDRPVPYGLLAGITEFRVAENQGKFKNNIDEGTPASDTLTHF